MSLIYKDSIYKFVELIKLKGDVNNESALFTVKDKELKVLSVFKDGIMTARGRMKVDLEDNELAVDNLNNLSKYINSFSYDEINFDKINNKLVLSSSEEKLQISAVLRNPDYIKNKITENLFEEKLKEGTGNEFILTEENIKYIVNYFNNIKADTVYLSSNGKKFIDLTLTAKSGECSLFKSFSLDKEVKPFKTRIDNFFINLLSTISEDVTISIKRKNTPIVVILDKKDLRFEYIVAPLEI